MKKVTFDEMIKDRKLFRELRPILTPVEKLWLLDCGGDYIIYRARLRRLAQDHGLLQAKDEMNFKEK